MHFLKYFAEFDQRISSFMGSACVLLEGNLGEGKTTFVREYLDWKFGIGSEVQSPTFLKVIEYQISTKDSVSEFHTILHLDCYRVEGVDGFAALGLENYRIPQMWFVEWPQVFVDYLCQNSNMYSVLGIQNVLRLNFHQHKPTFENVNIL